MKGKIHHNLGYIDCIDHRALPRVRYQTLGTRLKNKTRVGTLTCRSLQVQWLPYALVDMVPESTTMRSVYLALDLATIHSGF